MFSSSRRERWRRHGADGPALALLFLLSGAVPTALNAGANSDSPYDAGVKHYARGDYVAAKISFQAALRLDPNDRSARSALTRLYTESQLAHARLPVAPPPMHAPRPWERLLLVTLPSWFNFEDTLGNGLRDTGALTALNARITQLLIERRFAFANGRAFQNERRLRSLLRRTALAFPDREQV